MDGAPSVHGCDSVHALVELTEGVRDLTPLDGTLPERTAIRGRPRESAPRKRSVIRAIRVNPRPVKNRDPRHPRVSASRERTVIRAIRVDPRPVKEP